MNRLTAILLMILFALNLAGCGKKAQLRPPESRSPEKSEAQSEVQSGEPAEAVEGEGITDLYDPLLDRK